jgi:hypothetical protein
VVILFQSGEDLDDVQSIALPPARIVHIGRGTQMMLLIKKGGAIGSEILKISVGHRRDGYPKIGHAYKNIGVPAIERTIRLSKEIVLLCLAHAKSDRRKWLRLK